MSSDSRKAFIKAYSRAIIEESAAVFVGAGFSRDSGYVDWKGLLREIADELGLDVDKENDLVALAQFHVNKTASRNRLNQALIDEFTKDAALTSNHRLLASLPIETVWTTNYDDLLEQAYAEISKRVDVKRRKEDMAVTLPHRSVTIYKMHGCKTSPDDAVLTKQDYEDFDQENKRRAFSLKLQGDLLERTFLFVGFSFTDPNIDYILSRIRLLLGENQRTHYCIIKLPKTRKSSREAVRLKHRIDDLKRYCIQPIIIDDYSEITDILQQLNKASHLREVLVSGSADSYEPLGKDHIEELCRELGKRLIKEGYNLVSGYGRGIGGHVIIGAMEALERNDEQRLILRPFPQKAPSTVDLLAFKKRYREAMVQSAGVSIFLCGNKRDASGKIKTADGVLEEFRITKELGRVPIPIGVAGHAGLQIWKQVDKDFASYFPQNLHKHFAVLNDKTKSIQELIDAVMSLLKAVTV